MFLLNRRRFLATVGASLIAAPLCQMLIGEARAGNSDAPAWGESSSPAGAHGMASFSVGSLRTGPRLSLALALPKHAPMY